MKQTFGSIYQNGRSCGHPRPSFSGLRAYAQNMKLKEPQEKIVMCPCGARMQLRHTKDYSRHFYGCSRWPKCEYVQNSDKFGTPVGIPADNATREKRKELYNQLREFYNMTKVEDQRAVSTLISTHTTKKDISSLTFSEAARLIRKLADRK